MHVQEGSRSATHLIAAFPRADFVVAKATDEGDIREADCIAQPGCRERRVVMHVRPKGRERFRPSLGRRISSHGGV